jgi:hypothetical protein
MDWRSGLNSRTPASKVWSPEFKPSPVKERGKGGTGGRKERRKEGRRKRKYNS